jgi:hypothetical protein
VWGLMQTSHTNSRAAAEGITNIEPTCSIELDVLICTTLMIVSLCHFLFKMLAMQFADVSSGKAAV